MLQPTQSLPTLGLLLWFSETAALKGSFPWLPAMQETPKWSQRGPVTCWRGTVHRAFLQFEANQPCPCLSAVSLGTVEAERKPIGRGSPDRGPVRAPDRTGLGEMPCAVIVWVGGPGIDTICARRSNCSDGGRKATCQNILVTPNSSRGYK